MLDLSFLMFIRPMATSSERTAPSRLFGCLELSVMVETKYSHEVVVLGKGHAGDSER